MRRALDRARAVSRETGGGHAGGERRIIPAATRAQRRSHSRHEVNTVSTQLVASVRDRILPMLQVVANEYRTRVPAGYPIVNDNQAQGVIGIELDPAHSLYFVTDGDSLFADFYYRSTRYDARSSASREKFGGAPFQDRRPLPADISDQGLRNLIAELQSRYNSQQLIIHITDT
jgi:hypothetical protein